MKGSSMSVCWGRFTDCQGVNVRRVRSKSDLEPVSPPVDLHIAKRRKTITNFDDSNHEKPVEDRYSTYVESAKVPITKVLKAPPPIDTHTAITDEFLEHAINYDSDRLKFQRVTPRTAAILRRYLELAEIVKATQGLLDKVRLQECHQILLSKAFLLQEASNEDLERDQALRSLSTLRYYLEYGDYVGEYCKEFREKAVAAMSEGHQCFTGKTWSEVESELQEEAASLQKWHRAERRGLMPDTPMTDAINTACANGNYDITQIRYSIRWYAKRNEHAHNGVAQMIQRCDFEKLGNRLISDLKSIPTVLGVPDQAMMEKVLERIRDPFFVEVREHGKASKLENTQAVKERKQKADAKVAAKIRKRARQSNQSESADQEGATRAQTGSMGTGNVEQDDAEGSNGDHVKIVTGR